MVLSIKLLSRARTEVVISYMKLSHLAAATCECGISLCGIYLPDHLTLDQPGIMLGLMLATGAGARPAQHSRQ